MRYCSRGHVNSDAGEFCVSCGQQLLAAQPTLPPAPPVAPPPVNPWGPPSPRPPLTEQGTGWQSHSLPPVTPPPQSNRGWILGGIAAGVVVLLLGVFIITRTGSDGRDTPAGQATAQTVDPFDNNAPAGGSNSDLSDGEQVLALLESQNVYVSASPLMLDDLAETVCEALANGTSSTLLVGVAMDSGFSRNEATSLVAASIVVKCPWESG